MRVFSALVVTMLAAGLSIAADNPKPEGADGDEKAIRELLTQGEKAWNAHDMKAFMAHVAEDGDAVNRFGVWLKGRAAIEKHLVELHKAPFRDHLVSRSSKTEQVRFLSPEVAIAIERTKEETGQSVRTYVLQKRNGQWWIQSATVVQESSPPAG
jgi:uncharacterized protein (TIGR02246 family)